MAQCFGEYITNEYGLLKQILSYLQPCDLRNAKRVCRAWENAVESLLDKNPRIHVCHKVRGTPLKITKPILPDLVIHQCKPRCEGVTLSFAHYCVQCKQDLCTCPCQISGCDTFFVSFEGKCVLGSTTTLLYSFWQNCSTFLLPSSPKIRVSSFFIKLKDELLTKKITDEVMNLCLGGEDPIKCLLIISRSSGGVKKLQWLNRLMNKIIERQGLTFAVGGGVTDAFLCKTGYSFIEDQWLNPSILLITLRGEAVSAYSAILPTLREEEFDNFTKKMSESVGPLPKCATRIAFIAQCVNRTEPSMEATESIAFNNAFPAVPQFGFRAFGEFGINSSQPDSIEKDKARKRRKKTFKFNHVNSTSFVILTFDTV